MYHWIPFWPETAAVNAVVVNNLYIAELGGAKGIQTAKLAVRSAINPAANQLSQECGRPL